MEIKGAATVFQVKSVESALAFYVGVLGFAEDFRYSNYAGVSRGELYLHLCEHDVWKRPAGGGAVSIFFEKYPQDWRLCLKCGRIRKEASAPPESKRR